MSDLLQDVRFALRGFRRRPGHTGLALLVLALGAGGNTAILSIARKVLLDPLPFPDSARLVRISETTPEGSEISVSYPNYLDWRDQNRSFGSLAAFTALSTTLPGDPPERLNAHVVSGNFFSTLRISAALGRALAPGDDLPAAAPVAMLSHTLWQRGFGGDPSVVGRTLLLEGRPHTIVGVAPLDFRFYEYGDADLWTPLGPWARDPASDTLLRRSHAGLYVIGRLRDDVSLDSARADMDAVRRRLTAAYPTDDGGHGVRIASLKESVVGDSRPAIAIVSGAALLLLGIACANVTGLLLARWTERRREIGIRLAIGANRSRLVRQLATENATLAATGAIVGLAVGEVLLRALVTTRSIEIARLSEARLDPAVFAAVVGTTVASAILFGLVPAFRSASTPDALARRDGSGSVDGRTASVLIATEIAFSVVLLAATGLLVRSFSKLIRVDPGFDVRGVLTARLDAPDESDAGAAPAFYDRVLGLTRRLPGVSGAAVVNPLPLGSANRQDAVLVEGRPFPSPADTPSTDVAIVSPGYFGEMRIPLLRGRAFLASDDAAAPRVAVVSAAAARRFWPGLDPLGRRFAQSVEKASAGGWFTVIGIVGDVRLAIDALPKSEIYFTLAQRPMSRMTLIVRSKRPLDGLAAELGGAIRRVDARQPLYRVAALRDVADAGLADRLFLLRLLGGFGALGTLLAVAGLGGLVGRIVAHRTREIGVRIALGATGVSVVSGVLRRVAGPVAAGLAGGLAAALAAKGLLRSVLYGVATGDPTTFLAVPLLLAVVAAVAAGLPALRAARIDPMQALRDE